MSRSSCSRSFFENDQLRINGQCLADLTSLEYRERCGPMPWAIAKDPTYALAYSGLADSYTLFAVYGLVPPKEAFPKAKNVAERSLEIDDTLAEAHVSLGPAFRRPAAAHEFAALKSQIASAIFKPYCAGFEALS